MRTPEMVERPASNASTGKAWLKRVQGKRSFALSVLMCLFVGCSRADEARFFRTALPQEAAPPLPVALRDMTGLVSTIGPANRSGVQFATEALADPTDPKAFVITCLGGPCERNAALFFTSQGGRYFPQLVASQRGDCPTIAYPRGVRIATTVAIPISSIEVTGSG